MHDEDEDNFPNTYRDIDIDEFDDDMIEDDFDDDDRTSSDEDFEELFDEDGEVSDRGYAMLAEMDRNGHFV